MSLKKVCSAVGVSAVLIAGMATPALANETAPADPPAVATETEEGAEAEADAQEAPTEAKVTLDEVKKTLTESEIANYEKGAKDAVKAIKAEWKDDFSRLQGDDLAVEIAKQVKAGNPDASEREIQVLTMFTEAEFELERAAAVEKDNATKSEAELLADKVFEKAKANNPDPAVKIEAEHLSKALDDVIAAENLELTDEQKAEVLKIANKKINPDADKGGISEVEQNAVITRVISKLSEKDPTLKSITDEDITKALAESIKELEFNVSEEQTKEMTNIIRESIDKTLEQLADADKKDPKKEEAKDKTNKKAEVNNTTDKKVDDKKRGAVTGVGVASGAAALGAGIASLGAGLGGLAFWRKKNK